MEAIFPSYDVLKSRPSFCQDIELMAFCEGPIGFGVGCLLVTNVAHSQILHRKYICCAR